jgi:hypothetical protein
MATGTGKARWIARQFVDDHYRVTEAFDPFGGIEIAYPGWLAHRHETVTVDVT